MKMFFSFHVGQGPHMAYLSVQKEQKRNKSGKKIFE
jgi:hypothetical protein